MIPGSVLTWTVQVTVTRIVDGDTFSGKFDLGWGIFKEEVKGAPSRVRILNYNAPEKTHARYQEAITFLAALIPPGTKVWCVSHSLDSFGRALCDVYLPDNTNILDKLPSEWRKLL